MAEKKKRKCNPLFYDSNCPPAKTWLAPFYGDGKGHSGATIPHDNVSGTGGQSPSPASPAYPGEGGYNAPDVAGGAPNAGTGPVGEEEQPAEESASRGSVLKKLEDLNFMNQVMDPKLPATTDAAQATAPVAVGSPIMVNVLQAQLHDAFASAANAMLAHGYLDAAKRAALEACMAEALQTFQKSIQDKCPWAMDREIMPVGMEAIMGESVVSNGDLEPIVVDNPINDHDPRAERKKYCDTCDRYVGGLSACPVDYEACPTFTGVDEND